RSDIASPIPSGLQPPNPNENTTVVNCSTGHSFASSFWINFGSFDLSDSNDYKRVGDFNGDGLTDFASIHNFSAIQSSNVHMMYSDGKGRFIPATLACNFNFGAVNETWNGDFNGDGQVDFLTKNGATLTFLLTREQGQPFDVVTQSDNFPYGDPNFMRVGDFN